MLMEKLTVLVSELVSILKSCHSNDELLGHVLSTVSTLVDNHLAAMEESHRTELKVTLHDKLKAVSPSEHKVQQLSFVRHISLYMNLTSFSNQSLPFLCVQ